MNEHPHAHNGHRHTVCGTDGTLLNAGTTATAPCIGACRQDALEEALRQRDALLVDLSEAWNREADPSDEEINGLSARVDTFAVIAMNKADTAPEAARKWWEVETTFEREPPAPNTAFRPQPDDGRND